MRDASAGPLRRRALPVALALALVALTSLLTDTVAAAQVVSLSGAPALSAVYMVSGVLLGLSTMAQFTRIDRRPRLATLRLIAIGLGFASALALVWALIGAAPTLAVSVVWIVGDQVQLLLPVVLWSLAGDVFNAAESKRIYGWILGWTFGGQILGLVLATATPVWFSAMGIPLIAVLAVTPAICAFIAIWIPIRMRHSGASMGSASTEGLRPAITAALVFLRDVPTWRALVIATIVTATAGALGVIGFTASAESILGPDADRLQILIGGTALVVLVLSLVFELTLGTRIRDRIPIQSLFLVLPLASIASGVLLAVGSVALAIPVIALAMVILGVPTYTLDDGARQGALTLVPDHLRARISFVIELGRYTVAQVVAGLIMLVGSALGWFWLSGLLVAVLAGLALPSALKVRRTWEDSHLNWRLRRRKHLGIADLDDWGTDSSDGQEG